MKRVFLIVLDSLGIGAEPDAAEFGDNNPNTLQRISKSKYFACENMLKMGLGNIDGIDYLPKEKSIAAYGRCREKSRGKDTTIGHWEIAGIVSKKPMPTYPLGFPENIINEFSEKTGRGVLCNKPYSGTEVIKDYGEEHLKTGKLIVYTSADSVFQIAASEDIISREELYGYCKIAREILTGDNAVGRVIARPFKKENGKFVRTDGRHDFSVAPPADTMLDAIKKSGKTVYAIGKINDIFAGCGITEKQYTSSNTEGMKITLEAVKNKEFEGLCFTNLVDFDMLYGHRQDIDGYAAAFSEFDGWLPSFINEMRKEDILIITADHGCDPGDEHTDHTREYTPFILYGSAVKPENLGTRESFSDIAATVCDYLGVDFKCAGKTVLKG
ncbi:MAG: phosphopentomutase [Clostridiales bacterium]|nr:phosphopentomutase [Candidatus Equinaster intestinalis]